MAEKIEMYVQVKKEGGSGPEHGATPQAATGLSE